MNSGLYDPGFMPTLLHPGHQEWKGPELSCTSSTELHVWHTAGTQAPTEQLNVCLCVGPHKSC